LVASNRRISFGGRSSTTFSFALGVLTLFASPSILGRVLRLPDRFVAFARDTRTDRVGYLQGVADPARRALEDVQVRAIRDADKVVHALDAGESVYDFTNQTEVFYFFAHANLAAAQHTAAMAFDLPFQERVVAELDRSRPALVVFDTTLPVGI